MGWRPEALAALAALLLAAPVAAQGLDGRTVLFRAETWDDPDAPYLRGSDYVGRVGKGPEFGMVRELNPDGSLGVVPVVIDVADGRVDFSYPGQLPSEFYEAAFNGYVLTFPTECTLIRGARIDPGATTLPLEDTDLILTPQSLSLNVAGHPFDETTRIGVVIDVGDCPIS